MTEIPLACEISIEFRVGSRFPELLSAKLSNKKRKKEKKQFTVTVSEGRRKRPFKIYVAGPFPLFLLAVVSISVTPTTLNKENRENELLQMLWI